MPYKDKEVKKQKGREYYQQHREKMREQQRKYRHEHRGEVLIAAKAYYQENREERIRYNLQYYQEHKKQILERQKASYDKWWIPLKKEVLTYYGGSKLACLWCSYSDIRALSIDHINDDGAEERKQLGSWSTVKLYAQLKERGYPEGYQTLCMNCQFIKKAQKKGVGKE